MAFSWDKDKPAVAMTSSDAELLVAAVVNAVAEKAKDGQLDNYRQLARLEIDLAKARDDMARMTADNISMVERKDAEITALRSHINYLNSMVATLVPSAANFQMTSPVPAFPDRFAASSPVPHLDGVSVSG